MDLNAVESVQERVSNKQLKRDRAESLNKPSQFSDINISNERDLNELYCDFKCRQWWVNRITKRYLRGRTIWNKSMGVKHGRFQAQ